MLKINGETISYPTINGNVPEEVYLNNSLVWKNTFTVNFTASFYFGSTSHSSGCSSWMNDDLRYTGIVFTCPHFCKKLNFLKIILYFKASTSSTDIESVTLTDNNSTELDQFYSSNQYSVPASQCTGTQDGKYWCGETDFYVKVEAVFKYDDKKVFSVTSDWHDTKDLYNSKSSKTGICTISASASFKIKDLIDAYNETYDPK